MDMDSAAQLRQDICAELQAHMQEELRRQLEAFMRKHRQMEESRSTSIVEEQVAARLRSDISRELEEQGLSAGRLRAFIDEHLAEAMHQAMQQVRSQLRRDIDVVVAEAATAEKRKHVAQDAAEQLLPGGSPIAPARSGGCGPQAVGQCGQSEQSDARSGGKQLSRRILRSDQEILSKVIPHPASLSSKRADQEVEPCGTGDFEVHHIPASGASYLVHAEVKVDSSALDYPGSSTGVGVEAMERMQHETEGGHVDRYAPEAFDFQRKNSVLKAGLQSYVLEQKVSRCLRGLEGPGL